MGRTVNDTVKSSRIQIRISDEDREKIEEARKKYRPRMQFQDFLLELMDYGLEAEERSEKARKSSETEKDSSDFHVSAASGS